MQAQAHEIVVPSREVETIELAPGETLVSVEGLVWVTAHSEGRDIILGPGEEIRFEKKSRAIVGGFGGRGVTVRKDTPAAH